MQDELETDPSTDAIKRHINQISTFI